MSGAGAKPHLTEAPTIHEGAQVDDCTLGVWTEGGKGTILKASRMGDYSYITRDCQVVWTTFGKNADLGIFTLGRLENSHQASVADGCFGIY